MANEMQKLHQSEKAFSNSLSWKKNPAVQKLIDNLVQIIAEEYVQKARQNPDIFSSPK